MDSADCCIVSDSNLKDKEEWFLDVKGHLIVSIYNISKTNCWQHNSMPKHFETDFSWRFESFNLLQTKTTKNWIQ